MNRRTILRALAFGFIQCGISRGVLAQQLIHTSYNLPDIHDDYIKDYLHKMINFDKPHQDDMYIPDQTYNIFTSIVMRLRRLQQFVGHGNFQMLSFDDGLRFASTYHQVEPFTKAETRLMEMIFYSQAEQYGFFSKKPLTELTARIKKEDVERAPHSNIILYKGIPMETFNRLKKQIGDQLILTSGVRGIMKQFLLFLNKAYNNNGNLSLASRSLAPPGYSYHGIGDFDIGQTGLGAANFSRIFARTEVFKRLNAFGYITFRYPDKNMLGVRFEPWHIRVTA
ncbi:MAG: M15 family metallopeptidase [Nitrospiraceae bacterium]|nr:MAG: M15 family metallopeptidase [Nitrospiraceae bacterium]